MVKQVRGEGGFAKVYSAAWEGGEEENCVLKVTTLNCTRESYAPMRCPRILKLSSAFQRVDNLGLDVLVWAPIKH